MAFTLRKTLKDFFRKNQIPTEQQFGQLIDSSLNMAEDHIFKRAGEPLGIEVGQPASSRQSILNLYRTASDTPVWGLELNPGDNSGDGEKFYTGFSIADKNFKSRFFVKEADSSSEAGRVGIGTINPLAQLHISNVGIAEPNQAKIDNDTIKVDGALIDSMISLEAGERTKGNIGSIRLNGYETNAYSLIKSGKSSLELDSKNGELRINSDASMHAGMEGFIFLYGKNGTIDTQLTSDDTHSFINKGNFGIGTTNPSQKLEVNGKILSKGLVVNQTDTTIGGLISSFNSDSEHAAYLNFSHKGVRQLYLEVGKGIVRFQAEQGNSFVFGGGDLVIDNAGPNPSLCIGTSAGTGMYRDWMKKGMLVEDSSDGLYLGMKNVGSNRSDSIIGWGDDANDKLHVMYLGSGNAPEKEIMTIVPTGKVGINNPNPSFDLDVIGDIKSSNVLYVDKKSGSGSVAQFKSATTEAPYIGVYHHNQRSFYLQGDVNVAQIVADKASRIQMQGGNVIVYENLEVSKNTTVSGRIGIGNSNPLVSLHIGENRTDTLYRTWMEKGLFVGDSSDGLYLGTKFSSSNRSDAVLAWGDDSNDKFRIMYLAPGNAPEKEIMTMLPSGYVGINKTNPSSALDVEGNIKASRALVIENTANFGGVASFRTTSAEAPYISMYHGSTPRSFYLMAGNHAGENVVRFVADSATKFRFYSGDVDVHENLKVHKNIDVSGEYRVNGQKPFIFRRYNVNAGNTNTTYLVSEYQAAIIGFRALGGDIYENGKTNPIQVYMFKSGTVWAIGCDFASHGSHEKWQVDIMYISNKFAGRVESSW